MITFIVAFLGAFVLSLVQFYVIDFSSAVFFAYVLTYLAIMDSYRKSEVGATSRLGKLNKASRALVAPFSLIERAVKTRYQGAHLREALFGSYAAFELSLLLAIPFLFAALTGQALVFEVLNTVLIVIVISAGRKISRPSPTT